MAFANSSPGDCVHLGKRHNSSTTPMKVRTKDRLRRFGKLKNHAAGRRGTRIAVANNWHSFFRSVIGNLRIAPRLVSTRLRSPHSFSVYALAPWLMESTEQTRLTRPRTSA